MTDYVRRRHFISQHVATEKDSYLAEIEYNLGSLFNRAPLSELYYYISNMTATTLAHLHDSDRPLVRADAELRRATEENVGSGFEHQIRLLGIIQRELVGS